MIYKDIIKNIKSKNLEKIYLFYGRENILIDNAIKSFKDILNKDMIDFNLDILEIQVNLDTIRNSVETVPFMDDKKVVIVKEFDLLKNSSISEAKENEFIEYIKSIPESSVLVFINSDINKDSKLLKMIKKEGIVCDCDKLSEIDLYKWVRKKFDLNGAIIENAQIAYFIQQTGYLDRYSKKTLNDLENEINKIGSFIDKDKKVSNYIIDKLLVKKVENDIFKLIDFISQKKAKESLKILNDILDEGQSVSYVFSMISNNLKLIIQTKLLVKEGKSNEYIKDKLNKPLFVISKAIKQGKYFSYEEIIRMLNSILDYEYKIKRNIMKDEIAIDMFISEYVKK